ncbi:MAG TPA: DUF3014 domain-containing protein [Rhodocyclaceae bacterium]|nr:DUF3014 domain-containing protein [Rhodocyclaceae bacterium]
MRKIAKWGVALLVLLAALTGAYIAWLYWRMPVNTEEIEAPAPPPVQPPPPVSKPETAHPLVAEEAPVVANTTVESSDDLFTRFVISLFGGSQLPDFVFPDRMLRRFVATVDNLPRKELAARIRPVKPAPGMFMADKQGDILSIAPQNEARYEHYVNALESIDVPAMVKFYASHYALFQKAYQELGYAGNFNDRLFEAIDDLLATPKAQAPVMLVQPKVMYRFADPDMENRSAGQKIMLRMGADNSTRVKTVLTKVRAELKRYDTKH